MQTYDFVIIGGGPAGMAAGQYSARANLSTLIIEEMAHGGQVLRIDRLENYPGLAEPIDGYSWAEAMKKQADNFGVHFFSASVKAIEKKGSIFIITTTEGSIEAKAVLAASGAKQRLLEVPGEKEFTGRGISYCASCDGPLYKNKKILVVGGGDAACDEAQYLSRLSDKIVMIHRKSSFRAQKSLAERVLSNPSISVRFNTVIESIKGSKKVESATLRNLNDNTSSTEEFSAVFVFIGSIPQTNYCPALLKKDESGSIIVNENMETNIPGLFAAGDVRTSPFRQVVTAVSDGAIAAHSASRYIDELEGRTYS